MRVPSLRRSIPLLVLGLMVTWPTALVEAQTAPKVVPASLRVRAFGDAVTAGFGLSGSGSEFPISDAPLCRPEWIGDGSATTAGTRCSSNGTNGPGSPADEVTFAADFGTAHPASWAAQVARDLGAVDFANYAVSGSSLVGWLNLPRDARAPAEGAQHELLERIERDDPDLVLATLGGESLLQQASGPVRNCAQWSDEVTQTPGFLACVDALLGRELVTQRLMAIAFDVLAHTRNAKLVFATYLPASPRFSTLLPWQQRVLASAVNEQIVAAVRSVGESGLSWAQRIDVVQSEPVLDRCTASAIPAPALFARAWFVAVGPCASGAAPTITDPSHFTSVSLGTVPGAGYQVSLSRPATALIRAHGWA